MVLHSGDSFVLLLTDLNDGAWLQGDLILVSVVAVALQHTKVF